VVPVGQRGREQQCTRWPAVEVAALCLSPEGFHHAWSSFKVPGWRPDADGASEVTRFCDRWAAVVVSGYTAFVGRGAGSVVGFARQLRNLQQRRCTCVRGALLLTTCKSPELEGRYAGKQLSVTARFMFFRTCDFLKCGQVTMQKSAGHGGQWALRGGTAMALMLL
jgi:hypothetical protein